MPLRLRDMRKSAGMTERQLAVKLGVSHATISRYERGKTRIDAQMLERIAETFGVGISDLFDLPQHDPGEPIWVPIVGRIPAGRMSYADEDIEGYMPMPASQVSGGKCFYLRVRGDCMAPQIPDGSLVLVRQQSMVEDGQIAVVLEGEEATLKRVYLLPDKRIVLRADNPTTPPVTLHHGEAIILGKVEVVTREVR